MYMKMPQLWLITIILICGLHLQSAPMQKDGNQSASRADTSITVIPFDYKQSALYLPYTYQIIDSVAELLKNNKEITLTINGYAHNDEGTDTIIKYLSQNRAIFVREYILGRGITADRVLLVQGLGKQRPRSLSPNKDGKILNCRAEIVLNYPPPPKTTIDDRDKDGVADVEDKCPDVFGYAANKGCPVDAVIVPFQSKQSSLFALSYNVLDSVAAVLKNNPSYSLSIEGHSYTTEGSGSVCDRLSRERANIVKEYLMTRRVSAVRIDSIESFGSSRPLNAGDTPLKEVENSRANIILNRHDQ